MIFARNPPMADFRAGQDLKFNPLYAYSAKSEGGQAFHFLARSPWSFVSGQAFSSSLQARKGFHLISAGTLPSRGRILLKLLPETVRIL
jgi:hypothetical protein